MSTRFFEETWKYRLFFTRRRFVCEMSITDASAFSLIFSTATAKLKAWHDQHPRAAVAFELRLTATPLVLQKARMALQELYDSGGSYEFVKKIQMGIRFTDTTGKRSEYLDFVPA